MENPRIRMDPGVNCYTALRIPASKGIVMTESRVVRNTDEAASF